MKYRQSSIITEEVSDAENLNIDLNFVNALNLELASKTVSNFVSETPIISLGNSPEIPCRELSVKMETFTDTKSFKLRGAAYFLQRLREKYPEKQLKIFAASTGNHGISLSYLAQKLGIKVTIVVPVGTANEKKKKIMEYDARLIESGAFLDDSLMEAKDLALKMDGIYLDSTHSAIILGHASLGRELFKSKQNIDTVFFPVGVGSGIASLILARNILSPQTQIFGVVPESCKSWQLSHIAGKPVKFSPQQTIADGLRTSLPNDSVFSFVNNAIEDIVTVTEAEIKAVVALSENVLSCKPEGAGAVGLAGLLKFAKSDPANLEKHFATAICGGLNKQ